MSAEPARVAIVTGGARNIGAAICRCLARDGHSVVVNYHSSAAQAEALVAEITAAGSAALAVQGDVTDPAAVRGLFDAATERFGGVDVLINNAGVGTQKPVPIAETDDELFGHIFDVNTKAVFFGMREAARRLRDGGRIVSISTALIGLALPGRAIYAGSKAAVEVFTNIMAKELRGRGITVNAIAPGPIATPLFLDGKSREEIDNFAKQAPMERLGTPEDIAEAVAFLVSEAGGWIDGQTIRANGGMV